MKKLVGKKGLLYFIAVMLIIVFVFSQIAAWAGEELVTSENPGEEEILDGEDLEEMTSAPEVTEEETQETQTEDVSEEETTVPEEESFVEEETSAEETTAEEDITTEETTAEPETEEPESSEVPAEEPTAQETEETEDLELAEVIEETEAPAPETTAAEETKAPVVAEKETKKAEPETTAAAKPKKDNTVKTESASGEKENKKSNDVKTLAKPKMLSADNTPDGVKITWSAVEGADWYYIYYWNDAKQKYVKFAWTYDTSFVDTKAKSGKMYYYMVYAVAYGETKSKKDYIWSDRSAAIKGMYLTPVSEIRANADSAGATLSWDKVKGADGYWLYWRKPGATKWIYFKKVTKNSYYDSTAKPGKTYEYLVQPYAKQSGKTFSAYYDDSYGNTLTMTVSGTSDMNSKAQYYTSSTNYLIMVDCGANWLGIYQRGNSGWELYKYWRCTTGSGGSPTCKGVYTINYKGYAFGTADYTCYYFSSFNGPYYIHSTKYYAGTFEDKDARLGMSLSGGCVRLAIENAKFIYDYIPIGTTVVTYINN